MISNYLIYLKDISIYNNSQPRIPLFHLDEFKLKRGEVHGIFGDTGSGKTLFCQFLNNERYYTGSISGSCVKEPKNLLFSKLSNKNSSKFIKIQFLHQENFIPNSLTVENFSFLLLSKIKSKNLRKIKEIKYLDYLQRIAVSPFDLIQNLSLSQKTLLALVSCVICDPDILVLDSIFHRISEQESYIVDDIIEEQKQRNAAVIILSRQFDYLYPRCDNISLFKNNSLYITRPPQDKEKWTIILQSNNFLKSLRFNTAANPKDFQEALTLSKNIILDLPLMILYVDRNYQILVMNNTAKNFFQISVKELPISLTHFIDKNTLDLVFSVKSKSPDKYSIECFSTKINNIDYYFSLSGFSIKPDPSELTLISPSNYGDIIVLQDITEQEKIRSQLNISEKQFSVGILAAGVAHEINNPLEILMNNLDFFLLDPPKEEQNQVIYEMKTTINDIHEIINNLINFSHDDDETNLTPININSILKHLIKLISYSADSKNVEITFDYKYEYLIQIHQTKVRLILLNLLKNSFEAMKSQKQQEGKINISIDNLSPRDPRFKTHCQLIYQDNGPGIPESEIKNIFLPFYTKKKKTGSNMGLGMAITYQTIQGINGEIVAENVRTGGLKYIITLPFINKFERKD